MVDRLKPDVEEKLRHLQDPRLASILGRLNRAAEAKDDEEIVVDFARNAPVDIYWLLNYVFGLHVQIEQLSNPVIAKGSRADESLEGELRMRQMTRKMYLNDEGPGSTGPAYSTNVQVWQVSYVDEFGHVLRAEEGESIMEAVCNLAIALGDGVSFHEDAARERNG